MMKTLLAALIFFTRLPFWRLCEVEAERFKHVVAWWPWVGWLTGGAMALTLWLAAQVVALPLAWFLAIVVRLLITGALHEDGLADFFDGFGGGTTRQRTLEIMKDSHIGTYGVLALLIYIGLLWQLPLALPLEVLCLVAFAADCWSKLVAAQLINVLPYARPEAQSKAKVVYQRMRWGELLVALVGGVVPLLLLPWPLQLAAVGGVVAFLLLWHKMHQRLGGYTGDCCGATFLLCELAFYLLTAIIWKLF